MSTISIAGLIAAYFLCGAVMNWWIGSKYCQFDWIEEPNLFQRSAVLN